MKHVKRCTGTAGCASYSLKHVGIKDLKWPLVLKDPKRGEQHSVAVVQLSVDLPKEQRGTHMSRFVECLKELGRASQRPGEIPG